MDDLALPIQALASARHSKNRVGSVWTTGLYDVDFVFHLHGTVPQAATLLKKEFPDGVLNNIGYPNPSFDAVRIRDGIEQRVNVSQTSGKGAGSKEVKLSRRNELEITVSERVQPLQMPSRWYVGAISNKPPVPMIDVPFLPGVKCQSVEVTSLEWLLANLPNANRQSRDAAIYHAFVRRSYHQVHAAMSRWAKAHGYTLKRGDRFFRPRTKLFQMECSAGPLGKKPEYCEIYLYTSDKKVDTPTFIVWNP
ncbi:hypothetical protein [Fimbriimonas ginsengisoli]|uniref:hypothetical protein n=1 Tax=Fimbriimonas ginsengisoli TaxID=1005039 RepID=UPI0011849037|nr:hypothetical protein [Fimbriimonas ginsengisoli]